MPAAKGKRIVHGDHAGDLTTATGLQRRDRVGQTKASCERCRSSKLKCDDLEPACARCRRAGANCQRKARGPRPSYKSQAETLLQQVRQLEAESRHADSERDEGSLLLSSPSTQDHTDLFSSTFTSGSLSLENDGSLAAQGIGTSFFRTRKIIKDPLPSRASRATLAHLYPPLLPISISPQFHRQIVDLAFERMINFGRYVDEETFHRDILDDPWRRTAHYSPFIHLIVLTVGFLYLDRTKYQPEINELLLAAQRMTFDEMSSPRLSSIGGFILLSAVYVGLGEDNRASAINGIAQALASDFGLNRDAEQLVSDMTPLQQQVNQDRRHTWSTMTIVNSFWDTYVGRPTLRLPHPDSSPLPVLGHVRNVDRDAFTVHVALASIAREIIEGIYTDGVGRSTRSLKRTELDQQLLDWHHRLPSHLTLNTFQTNPSPPAHLIALHFVYHMHTIHLHRPFMAARGRDRMSEQCLSRASEAATSIVWLAECTRQTPAGPRGLPLTVQHAVYTAGTVLLLVAAGIDGDNDNEQQMRKSIVARQGLDIICHFLQDFGDVWPASRDSLRTLKSLAREFIPGNSELYM